MLIFCPDSQDQDRRHTPSSWTFACWYAFALLDERIGGNWPDPQPAAMARHSRDALTPRDILDGKHGNRFKARGTAIEKAFGNAITKHAPRKPMSATAQPRRETIPRIAGEDEDACADWEFRWSGDPSKGYIFDVTAVNTRSEGRVEKYTITATSAHLRGSPHGPTGALNGAAREKNKKYATLYPESAVSGYAIDLVGTPSPFSRRALVALCKTAYKGTGNGEDDLYPLRMANAIQKEVAFATAKALLSLNIEASAPVMPDAMSSAEAATLA